MKQQQKNWFLYNLVIDNILAMMGLVKCVFTVLFCINCIYMYVLASLSDPYAIYCLPILSWVISNWWRRNINELNILLDIFNKCYSFLLDLTCWSVIIAIIPFSEHFFSVMFILGNYDIVDKFMKGTQVGKQPKTLKTIVW